MYDQASMILTGADASLKDHEGHHVLEWALFDMRSLISNSVRTPLASSRKRRRGRGVDIHSRALSVVGRQRQ